MKTDETSRAGRSEAGRFHALTSPAFVAALAVLLLNDRVLKASFPGWWTGKLSDFTGLFAFVILWAALVPNRHRTVFALTALGWLIWKSPLSDPLLAAWNSSGIWPIGRVIDYSDWLALAALIPAYSIFGSRRGVYSSRRGPILRRIAAIGSAATAIIAFSATSRVPPRVDVPNARIDTLPLNRAAILSKFASLGVGVSNQSIGKKARWADTLVVEIHQPPERSILVYFEVHETTPSESTIRLVKYSTWGPELRPESLQHAFETQVIERLQSGKGG